MRGSIIGTVKTYGDLRKAIQARMSELRMPHLAVDEEAGLQAGYTGKILCGSRHFGDKSFDAILKALKLQIVVVRACASHSDFPKENQGAQGVSENNFMSDRGRKGGKMRAGRMTNEERSASASRAGSARWRNWREVQKAKRAKAAKKPKKDAEE